MYTSYRISEEVNAQVIIWALAQGIYRMAAATYSVGRIAQAIVQTVWLALTCAAIELWQALPTAATLLNALAVIGKAALLSALVITPVIVTLMFPALVTCVGVTVAFAVTTKPR